jgi:hypothetical protein
VLTYETDGVNELLAVENKKARAREIEIPATYSLTPLDNEFDIQSPIIGLKGLQKDISR